VNLKSFVLKSVLSDFTFMQLKRKQVNKGVVNPGYRGLFQETENPSAGTSCYPIIAFNSSAQEKYYCKNYKHLICNHSSP